MKIIVTGATGFIGRHIAETFHREGMEILSTGRSAAKGGALQGEGISFVQADVTDTEQVESAFSRADCVIHCAGLAGDHGKYKEFFRTNVTGARNVINACKKYDIGRIIFISTPSVYFNGEDRYDIGESDPLPRKIRTHYAKTKHFAESELLTLRYDGFRTIVFRPRAVYGPYDKIIFPHILKLSEQKNIPMINGGKALIDVTCVGNLVSAVRNALNAPDTAWNEVYNISNNDPVTVRDWFRQVLEIFGRPFNPKDVSERAAKTAAMLHEAVAAVPFIRYKPSMTRFSVGYLARSMTLSIEKAKNRLGYIPHVSNREGLEEYAAWYRSER